MTGRILVALALCSGLLHVAPAAAATLEVEALAMGLHPWLGGTTFSATGQANGQPATFQARGDQLGLRTPWLAALQFGAQVLPSRYFGLGMRFEIPVYGAPDARPRDIALAGQVDTHSLSGVTLGAQFTGILPLYWFSLRLSLLIGYRSIGVPVTAFDQVRCGKGGLSLCYPQATYDTAAVQPRLSITTRVLPSGVLYLSAFVGVEPLSPVTLLAGAGLVLHLEGVHARRRRRL